MIYLGIDPGLAGAIATFSISRDGSHDLAVTATPTTWRTTGKRRRRAYALPLLEDLLATLPRPVTIAYVEAQTARPGQGVVSMFSTGYGAGMWEAFLTANHIPYVLVQPKRWRRLVGLPTYPNGTHKQTIKQDVALVARRRFPAHPISVEHADAVMLAVAAALEHGAEKHVTG